MKSNLDFVVILIILSVFVYFPHLLKAQGIKIDSTFGINGKLIMEDYPFDMSDDVIVYENGDILFVAADEDNTPNGSSLFKINQNGGAVKEFGIDGIVPDVIDLKSSFVSSIDIQTDGKIIIAGTFRNGLNESAVFITRFDSNGDRDLSYGIDGISLVEKQNADLKITSVEIIDDNYLIMAGVIIRNGNSNAVLIKLTPEGHADTTFGNEGFLIPLFSPTDAAINVKKSDDKKIVFTGYAGDSDGKFLIAKMNFDGILDKSFNGSGYNIFDILPGKHCEAFNFAFDQDENIVINGYVLDEFITIASAKVSKNGVLDYGFGVEGKMIYKIGPSSFSRSIKSLPDGSCLIFCFGSVSGQSPYLYDFILLKTDKTGKLDPEFGHQGIFNIDMGYEIDSPTFFAMNHNDIYLGGYGDNGDNLPGATFVVKLKLINETMDVNYEVKNKTINMYPSATDNFVTFYSAQDLDSHCKIDIFDVQGKLVSENCGFADKSVSGLKRQVDVKNLSPGHYFLRLNRSVDRQVFRFYKY